MPITNTLETARQLENADFPPKQAEVLSRLFEETARAVQQDLKTFIVEQLSALESRLEAKMEVRFAQMETRIAQGEGRVLRELRQQLIWFSTLQIAIVAAAFAAAKLLFG
jgi:hypothetical protein